MPLDPQAQKVVEALAALNLKPIKDSTPTEARESMRTRTAALGPFEEVAAVADHRVPVTGGEITVRVYQPAGVGPHPVLVFYHGGGWVIGDLYTHDGICRSMTPVEDSYAGLLWVAANATRLGLDAARIAVGGDSAGGNLAAVMALLARDRHGPRLLLQVLIYPVTNHDFGTVSYRENATGFVLGTEEMRWFWRHYLAREEQGREPLASPLLAKSLGDLPTALVVTAGCDPLRDEGEAYAVRLRDAGVAVTLTQYSGMFHGFLRMTRILDQSRALLDEVAVALRKALS